MSCDSYYEKNSLDKVNKVCQDYALHGLINDVEYAVVADGCSSATYSETGAMILCHIMRDMICSFSRSNIFSETEDLYPIISQSVYMKMNELNSTLKLPRSALEASLLAIVKYESRVFVFIWGDGVFIITKKVDGEKVFVIQKVEFSLNAPFYLMSNKKSYVKSCLEKGVSSPERILTEIVIKNGVEISCQEERKNFKIGFYSEYDIDEGNSFTICSDGILSYKDQNKNPVELSGIVPKIIDYDRINTGEFVKNRMFFFKKNNSELYHSDDMSIGTIFIK